MGTKALVAALGAGVLGAIAWALVSWKTGFEIGYLAWAIGGAVGFCAYALGSRGTAAGIICAIITLASIFGGKILAVKLATPEFAYDSTKKQLLSKESYDMLMSEAGQVNMLKTDEDIKSFMLAKGYAEPMSKSISAEEIKSFKEGQIPYLKDLAERRPSYEEWKKDEESYAETRANEASDSAPKRLALQDYVDAVKEDLGPIDAIFGFFGIGTAFSLASGRKQNGSTPPSGATPPTAPPA